MLILYQNKDNLTPTFELYLFSKDTLPLKDRIRIFTKY